MKSLVGSSGSRGASLQACEDGSWSRRPHSTARDSRSSRNRAANHVLTTREQRIGPVTDPRSPGWKPGDTGYENHPAVHAGWRRALSRFKPISHGTREGMHTRSPPASAGGFLCERRAEPRSPGWKPGDTGYENHPAVHATRLNVIPGSNPNSMASGKACIPGVPRLPPGAFCVSGVLNREAPGGNPGTPGTNTPPPSEPRPDPAGSPTPSAPGGSQLHDPRRHR